MVLLLITLGMLWISVWLLVEISCLKLMVVSSLSKYGTLKGSLILFLETWTLENSFEKSDLLLESIDKDILLLDSFSFFNRLPLLLLIFKLSFSLNRGLSFIFFV